MDNTARSDLRGWKRRFFLVLLRINDNITSHLRVRVVPRAEPLQSSCLLLERKARCDSEGRRACRRQTKSIFAPQKTRTTRLWRERTSLEPTGKTTAFTRIVLLPSHNDTTFLSHVFSLKHCFPVESHRLPIRSEATTTGSDRTCCANNACKSGCQISSRS